MSFNAPLGHSSQGLLHVSPPPAHCDSVLTKRWPSRHTLSGANRGDSVRDTSPPARASSIVASASRQQGPPRLHASQRSISPSCAYATKVVAALPCGSARGASVDFPAALPCGAARGDPSPPPKRFMSSVQVVDEFRPPPSLSGSVSAGSMLVHNHFSGCGSLHARVGSIASAKALPSLSAKPPCDTASTCSTVADSLNHRVPASGSSVEAREAGESLNRLASTENIQHLARESGLEASMRHMEERMSKVEKANAALSQNLLCEVMSVCRSVEQRIMDEVLALRNELPDIFKQEFAKVKEDAPANEAPLSNEKSETAASLIQNMSEEHNKLRLALGALLEKVETIAPEPNGSVTKEGVQEIVKERVSQTVSLEVRRLNQQRNRDYSELVARLNGLESTLRGTPACLERGSVDELNCSERTIWLPKDSERPDCRTPPIPSTDCRTPPESEETDCTGAVSGQASSSPTEAVLDVGQMFQQFRSRFNLEQLAPNSQSFSRQATPSSMADSAAHSLPDLAS